MKARLTRFTLLDIFGHRYEREGELLQIVTRGYNTEGGGWSLYGGRAGDIPAQFAIIRWKGKQKQAAVPVERIIHSVDPGTNATFFPFRQQTP